MIVAIVLPTLITAAQAQSSDFDGITLALPPFPSMRYALYDSASPRVLLAAAADAPASTGSAPAVSAPSASSAGANANQTPVPMASLTDGLDPDSPYTQVFDLGSSTGGPAWVIIPTAGITEVFTDNASRSSIDKQAAAITSLHASLAARGDTARLQAGLAYTGRYRKGFGGGARSSGFTHAGSALAHAIVIPDFLSLDVRGNARELQRVGYGNVNPDILNRSDTTQSFMATVSPDARWRVGNVGTSDLRYSYTRIWFQRNTGQISTPTGTLGPLSGATMQLATFNLSLPNTLIDRLFTNVQVSGSDQETNRGGGGFKRASAQAINEYRLGATFSGIVNGGYESLNSPLFTGGLGQGATWDVGGRWRPNVDSSIILLYGSHDLKTSMRGMVTYQLTPLTQFYAEIGRAHV